MTNTITSDLDEAHPVEPPNRADQREQRRAHIGADCLTDGPVGRVGLEIEAHCFDLADPRAPPGLGRAHRRSSRALPAAARRQR